MQSSVGGNDTWSGKVSAGLDWMKSIIYYPLIERVCYYKAYSFFVEKDKILLNFQQVMINTKEFYQLPE